MVIADSNAAAGERTAHLIRSSFGDAIFVRADVSVAEDVEAMVRTAVATFGRLDCTFNNAGITGAIGSLAHAYPEDTWDRVISLNLKGVWICMKHEIPKMLAEGVGAIVNIDSIWGLVGARAPPPKWRASMAWSA